MKKLSSLLLLLIIAVAGYWQQSTPQGTAPDIETGAAEQYPASATNKHVRQADAHDSDDNLIIESAYAAQRSNVQTQVRGTVSKILKDDNNGTRHQRFIVELPSGHTLLVAHNIDLAGRVTSLRAGDAITLYGEYEWNTQGGVLHWTHRDPDGSHASGWIEHDGHRYQ